MSGFEFRYRLSGRAPTIKSFVFKNTEALSRGDILNLEHGAVALGATGDTALVGAALETPDGDPTKASISAIVDADAVYAVVDTRFRLKGDTLDLAGLTGDQRVSPGDSAEFLVDLDSSAVEETLVRVNDGKHYSNAPPWVEQRPTGGEFNAAIARAAVRYHAEALGRGPTKAQSFYRGATIVIILEDTMTKGERTLVSAGREDAVLQTRQAFQDALRPYMKSTIERLTGAKVRAFLSANHIEPDVAAEIFILDRPLAAEPATGETRGMV
jgi:uncharacterized protein YbcI